MAFGAGLYSGITRNFAYKNLYTLKETLQNVVSERENILGSGDPIHFLQPSYFDGSDVTINELPESRDLIFLAGYFDDGTELRLIRPDGTVVANWPVRFSQHFPETDHLYAPPATDRNVDLHGAVINPDGSIVFNFEYSGTVKLDRCGTEEWKLFEPTHHSVEKAAQGGYWIPGRKVTNIKDTETYPPFTAAFKAKQYREDLIHLVSEDGEIQINKSIPKLLYDNGFEATLTAGIPERTEFVPVAEIVHVNAINELSAEFAPAFPMFEAGDLMISMRKYNLIFVVDPDTWQIKWHKAGPWLRQHDPEFMADGTIAIFNNNTHRILEEGERLTPSERVTNILKIDPSDNSTEVIYGDRPGEEFMSTLRGKHQPLPDGGNLITDFEGGRAVRIDKDRNIVWQYINRFDEDRVIEITEARLHPEDYFTVTDWSCP